MPFRTALRVVSLNAALLVAALSMIAVGGEAWLRLRHPFHLSHRPMEFSPGAGLVLAPNAEMRWTNMLDYWTISPGRTAWDSSTANRLPPELAQASCHVAFVGDSFVEAISVSVADKLPVRLEELAAERLPHLDVTTSAYGIRGTGQIAPVALVRQVDAASASQARRARLRGRTIIETTPGLLNPAKPGRSTWSTRRRLTAIKEDDGRITLRPPTPEWQAFQSG